ncbi:UNVERIFIED_CONTAM: hypothetical protein Slati_1904900 [Sesamum latifolium]|uniref:Uncharacterized protein n=1 Tax=Sesamum latifolium TaxID=2727402 RepID=A0AAW2X2K4_9LAMI
MPSPFPIHFVYSWIAHYFKTHYQVLQGVRGPKMTLFFGEGGAKYYDPQEARKRIHKGDFISWTCNIIAKDKDFPFVDDGRAKDFEEAYFMAIRSNYLLQGDHFDVEPYSPHRFGRQFGFFQEVPGFYHKIFAGRLWKMEFAIGVYAFHLRHEKVWFPSMPPNAKKFSSRRTKDGGPRLTVVSLKKMLRGCLVRPNQKHFPETKNMVKELSKICLVSVLLLFLPNVILKLLRLLRQVRRKSVSRPLEENESSNLDRHWKRPKRDSNIKTMNVDGDSSSHAPSMLNFAKELEDEVLDIEDDEASEDSQESIWDLICWLTLFQLEWVLRQNFLTMLRFDFISSIQDDVCFVLESMKSFQRFDVSRVEELLNVFFSKAAAYDKARSSSSEKLSKGQKQSLHSAQAKVHEIETEIAALENTTPLDDEAIENLESSRANLEVLKEELENLSPFT